MSHDTFQKLLLGTMIRAPNSTAGVNLQEGPVLGGLLSGPSVGKQEIRRKKNWSFLMAEDLPTPRVALNSARLTGPERWGGCSERMARVLGTGEGPASRT